MAQAIKHEITLATNRIAVDYTLEPGQNHVVQVREQIVQVLAGAAWISNNGDDLILQPGEVITLKRGGDNLVVISGLSGKPVRYTLS